MVVVGIYIYIDGVAKRLELFDDEKISVTSSIQNVSDISKIFTDFSQSFTVPASTNNNQIFAHWYDNSVSGGFDARKRKDAYIELDTIPFRNGKIQLESANLKDGKPENYSITFFGNLVSLKDTFKGLFLKDLTTLSAYDFSYTGLVVINKVGFQTTDNIKFPLITSNRPWTYGDSGANDIKQIAKPIVFNELFPALRLPRILDAIESFYDITFNGSFLTDARFTNAYLWLKNGDFFVPIGFADFVFDDIVEDTTYSSFDLPNNTFDFVRHDVSGSFSTIVDTYLNLTFTTALLPYTLVIYKDGVQYYTQDLVTTTGVNNIRLSIIDTGAYTFRINSASQVTFTSTFTHELQICEDGVGCTTVDDILVTQTTAISTSANVSVAPLMPNIKVEDFFSGLLKMFNLTCYSIDGTNYTIREIEEWYDGGDIIDITKHIISDTTGIDRIKPYKRINFEYEKSENLISTAYLSANGVQYGNLLQDFDADGEEYSIKLPFENMLFSNLSGRLQVGYSLKTDLKAYIPKPIILYDYGVVQTAGSTGFYFSDGSATTLLSQYNAFGSETNISSVEHSINFGTEQSSLTNNIVSNSLYFEYYLNYLNNLFTSKARKIKVKGVLPISLITSLELNDRLILRDKRYIINSFTTDLTSGEVDFELINDFRIL